MSEPAYTIAAVRAECQKTLARELFFRTFSHDVRGAVMGVVGWVELMVMEGSTVPAGLNRSLDKLNHVVGHADEGAADDAGELVDPAVVLAALPQIAVSGESAPVRLPPLRLLAALELTAPRSLALSLETRGGRMCLRMQIGELDPESVQLAMTPRMDALTPLIAHPSARLGPSLLRVVARTCGGDLRGEPPDRVSLYFPLP